MKLLLKTVAITVAFGIFCVMTFIWWGDTFETLFNQEACASWFNQLKAIGWLLGILLLVSDIILPVPATGIMSAMGDTYGFAAGWLFSATGSMSAGLLGYGLVRIWRERVASWLAKPEDLKRFQNTFDRWGGAIIIVSRIAPILPEVMTVLAGLAKMRFPYFILALGLGTLPVTALFSWWGSFGGKTSPAMTHIIAIIAPLLIWPIMLMLLKPQSKENASTPTESVE